MNIADEAFINGWRGKERVAYNTSFNNGFRDEDRPDPEALALIHSEISEALEALRHNNPPDDKIPKFSGLEAELADAVLRIMIMGYAKNLNIGGAIVAKMKYNEGREYRHGGKEF